MGPRNQINRLALNNVEKLSPRTKPDGAVEWSRTTDLLITNQLLYQLSYNSPEDDRRGDGRRAAR